MAETKPIAFRKIKVAGGMQYMKLFPETHNSISVRMEVVVKSLGFAEGMHEDVFNSVYDRWDECPEGEFNTAMNVVQNSIDKILEP